MPLTHFDIQSAKAATKPYKLADGGGLFLLIQINGSKLWRLKCRRHGAERSHSIGPYPTVSLAEARTKRDEAPHVRRRRPGGSQEARPVQSSSMRFAVTYASEFGSCRFGRATRAWKSTLGRFSYA
jgi:Arm DNA-binding domain